MKVYAVRKGRQTGLFETWDECKEQVSGFPGAEYKSFQSYDEAEDYLSLKKRSGIQADLTAYVDGSYNPSTREFSYGVVIIYPDGSLKKFSAKSADRSLADMRNVAGEIAGSTRAMDYALELRVSSLVIYYDYAGIEKWCTGEWKTNKRGTIRYKQHYDSIKNRLKISFVKVKSHSGDKYNDMADELAKEALS